MNLSVYWVFGEVEIVVYRAIEIENFVRHGTDKLRFAVQAYQNK